ncbi:ScbA/BarX family gamma-butyrolactone biosynthesis protein [Streptomyces sp. B-S-A8]|uniref:ScbA/BarX family gamma-butyrolactone biosynthesis protein n=1 Tax=Streptomyces solicavernae TaxID=3043614 RepID=A0ABT6S1N4_9ACTN|nr:ScbA/BarX family gamma-butyrolactone biosynthesis protein [Streptomyces sp. B-S-A8]MDI3390592.1 ScbA/BarX family gamma-butyrolactone biosynthesis protein [Streptomyces sp. B-S-A8]
MSSATAPQVQYARGHDVTRRSTQEEPREASRLTTTVPKEYVHRASLAEVFLTGCEKTDESTFALTGQWPRAHTFFNNPASRSHDHLQAVETIRQIGIFLAHSEFGIPLGYQFVMRDISATTYPEYLGIGHTPSDLAIETVFTKERRDTVLGVEITIRRDEHVVAIGSGHFTCVSPAAYRRLRGSALMTEIDYQPTGQTPSDYGRTLPIDLVLAPTEHHNLWRLNPDPSHPVMFDHGGDHMPGMVLLEAARQAACALLGPDTSVLPTTTVNRFQRYTEFSTPCWIEAVELPAQQPGLFSVQVTGHQNGRQVFDSQLSGPRVPSPRTAPGRLEGLSTHLASPFTGAIPGAMAVGVSS